MIQQFLESISLSITNALGWTIIHSLWQGMLLAIGMSIYHQSTTHKSADHRYKISIMTLVAMVGCSVATFLYYMIDFSSGVVNINQQTVTILDSYSVLDNSMLTSMSNFFDKNIHAVNTIWLIGVAIFLIKYLFSFGFILYLKYSLTKNTAPLLTSVLASIQSNYDFSKTIIIRESNQISVPMIIGYFKPLILFPLGIVNRLEIAEVEAIINHELAHIIRNDYLVNLLVSFVEVFYYYHPAIWWISANIRSERENSCDDIALDKTDSILYAKTLVKLEEFKTQGTPILAMPLLNNKHQLLNRIKRIMNMEQSKRDMKAKSIATLILLFGVLLYSTQAISSNEQSISTDQDENTVIDAISDIDVDIIDEHIKILSIDDKIVNEELKDGINNQKAFQIESKDIEIESIGKSEIVIINSEDQMLFDRSIVINDIKEVLSDTIPNRHQQHVEKMSILSNKNGKKVELEKNNSKVTKLIIDGKVIPKHEYKNHKDLIDSYDGRNIGLSNGKIKMFKFDSDDIDFNGFEGLVNDSMVAKSFGMIFDGNEWRDLGENMDLFFNEELLDKLEHLEENNFEFDKEKMKELQDELNSNLKGLEDFRGFDNMDSLFNNFEFDIDDIKGIFPKGGFEDIFEKRDLGLNRSSTVVDAIGSALNRDGLLKPFKSNKIEITGKHLKINGEKMPNALYEKYKNIYQEKTGAPLTKKSRMIFDVEGKKSNRKVRTF
ncbi:MAG: M56 family metallopeptidase [Saprospiraceae bacterium]